VGTLAGMTNPEYQNPGIVQTDEDKRKAYDAQQEVASRSPLTAVPDIETNAAAEQAAEEAKQQVRDDAKQGKAATSTGAAPIKRTSSSTTAAPKA